MHVILEVYIASNPKSKLHASKRISKLQINFINTKVYWVKSVNNKINCLHFHGNSKINTGGAWHHNKNNVLTKLKQLQSRNKHGPGSQLSHNSVHINFNITPPVKMEANCVLQLPPQKCVNSIKTYRHWQWCWNSTFDVESNENTHHRRTCFHFTKTERGGVCMCICMFGSIQVFETGFFTEPESFHFG